MNEVKRWSEAERWTNIELSLTHLHSPGKEIFYYFYKSGNENRFVGAIELFSKVWPILNSEQLQSNRRKKRERNNWKIIFDLSFNKDLHQTACQLPLFTF